MQAKKTIVNKLRPRIRAALESRGRATATDVANALNSRYATSVVVAELAAMLESGLVASEIVEEPNFPGCSFRVSRRYWWMSEGGGAG